MVDEPNKIDEDGADSEIYKNSSSQQSTPKIQGNQDFDRQTKTMPPGESKTIVESPSLRTEPTQQSKDKLEKVIEEESGNESVLPEQIQPPSEKPLEALDRKKKTSPAQSVYPPRSDVGAGPEQAEPDDNFQPTQQSPESQPENLEDRKNRNEKNNKEKPENKEGEKAKKPEEESDTGKTNKTAGKAEDKIGAEDTKISGEGLDNISEGIQGNAKQSALKEAIKFETGQAAKSVASGATSVAGTGAAGATAGAGAVAGGATAAAGGTAVAAEGVAVAGTGIAVGWPIIIIVIVVILVILLIVYLIGIFIPRTHTDVKNTADKAVIDEVVSLTSSGKISFVQADDLGKIKEGKIGKPSLQAMSYLAKKHESVQVNYNNQNYDGSNEPTSSGVERPTTGGSNAQNEPFEFDIAAVDSIKCLDTASVPPNKLAPIPISLKSNFDWNSLIKPEYTDKIRCAVGYYPGETPTKGIFVDKFDPGEFSILDLATAGPKAAQEKAAETTSEMLDIDSANLADKGDSLIPVRIKLDSRYAPSIIGNLANQIKTAYPNATSSDGVIPADNLPYGVHISYL